MARAVVKIEILFKKKTFFLNGLEKTKKPFFRKKSFFFFGKVGKIRLEWRKLLQNWCVVLRLDSSLFSF